MEIQRFVHVSNPMRLQTRHSEKTGDGELNESENEEVAQLTGALGQIHLLEERQAQKDGADSSHKISQRRRFGRIERVREGGTPGEENSKTIEHCILCLTHGRR